MRPILGLAILTAALLGGMFVGALGALCDTTPDWDE